MNSGQEKYLCVIGSVYHGEILSHISQRSHTMFVVARALIMWRSIQSCGDYCVPFLCCFVFKQWRVQHSSNASFFCLHLACSSRESESSSAHKILDPPSAKEVHNVVFVFQGLFHFIPIVYLIAGDAGRVTRVGPDHFQARVVYFQPRDGLPPDGFRDVVFLQRSRGPRRLAPSAATRSRIRSNGHLDYVLFRIWLHLCWASKVEDPQGVD